MTSLPLCLARYRPRAMIKHKVMNTTTATTPPINAWSGSCCPGALGSGEREVERERERERERESETERERDTERETERKRQSDRDTERVQL